MNITAILNIIGHVMKYEIILLLIPFFVALFYGQGDANAFLYTVLLMIPIALILIKIKGKKNEIYAKEGFLTVGLAWIVISFFGALPFVFSGAIPSLVDAFFETSSGFTTTGASILTEIQSLLQSSCNFSRLIILEKFYSLGRRNGFFNIYISFNAYI